MHKLLLFLFLLTALHPQSIILSKRVIPLHNSDNERKSFESNKKIALLIGVGTYPKRSGHQQLNYPAADTADLDVQLRVLGYSVERLIDAEATSEAVRNILKGYKERNLSDGTLIFYFSGHGWQEDRQNYLATYDAGVANLSGSGLPVAEVLELVKATVAKRQVMWIDACRNEPSKGLGSSGRSFGALEKAGGTHVLFSTRPGLQSYEDQVLRHGVFTYFLLNALSGEAVGEDRLLTVRDVSNFVIAKVANYGFEGKDLRLEEEPKQVPVEADSESGVTKEDFLLATAPRGPQVGDSKTNPVDHLRYVWIPPGTFLMGCSTDEIVVEKAIETASKTAKTAPRSGECRPDEIPAIETKITRGFWLGEAEVVQKAYENVMGENPSSHKGSNLPVGNVNWDQANNYCMKIGGRLPTEAEWEYAARGGNQAKRYGTLNDIAWHFGNSDNLPHTAGTKQANDFKLSDMLGNAVEWTADWYFEKLRGGNNPSGPENGHGRVLRGGSWANGATAARASFRGSNVPSYHYGDYGFRCVSY